GRGDRADLRGGQGLGPAPAGPAGELLPGEALPELVARRVRPAGHRLAPHRLLRAGRGGPRRGGPRSGADAPVGPARLGGAGDRPRRAHRRAARAGQRGRRREAVGPPLPGPREAPGLAAGARRRAATGLVSPLALPSRGVPEALDAAYTCR